MISLTLCQWLDANRFVIRKSVVLCFDTSVIYQGTSIRYQTTHGGTNIGVDFGNLFHRVGIQQGTCQALLDGQDATLLGLYSNRGGSQFDRLNGVFDLSKETQSKRLIVSRVIPDDINIRRPMQTA
jgi:hypothetical protein